MFFAWAIYYLEKVVIKTMTQYKYKVLQRKKELEEEGLDKEWSFMEAKYDKGKLVSITTGFKSGRRLTEYTDKRKKDKEEWQ